MSLLDQIYAKSPVFIQNVMATGYGMKQRMLRHRGEYEKFYAQLDRQQWLSREELQQLQDAEVRRTVELAAHNVPYYRELFRREGIRPEHVKTAADLRILPFTDKAVMQAHNAQLRSEREMATVPQTTGGTTGRPVPYWVTPSAIQFNYACYEARFRRWAGVEFGDRMVSINGKPIVPMTQDGPPYWRHNLAFNQLYVSAYHLSDATLPSIVERVAEFQPKVIVAYVTAVHRIARFMNEHGLALAVRPRAILVSSETLFDWQRRDMENAFGCKVFNGYSLGEPVCFVSECADGGMHVSPEFGVIELVEHEGQQEIVATGLINDAMPMLRYRTGDYASAVDGTCKCGRELPLLGPITGRIDEVVTNPEGAAVGPASLSLAFQSVPNLLESQIIQDTPEAITLKLTRTPSYGPSDEQFLLQELRKRLGLTLRIDLEYVGAIPKTVSGKQRLVISHIKGRHS